MPQDYYCDQCDYGISIGFSHYVCLTTEGYGGWVQFVCKECFITHSREIGPGKERFLYQSKKLKMDEEWGQPMEQEKGVVSDDQNFRCPICKGTEMITDKDIEPSGRTEITCPDCEKPMRYLGTRGIR